VPDAVAAPLRAMRDAEDRLWVDVLLPCAVKRRPRVQVAEVELDPNLVNWYEDHPCVLSIRVDNPAWIEMPLTVTGERLSPDDVHLMLLGLVEGAGLKTECFVSLVSMASRESWRTDEQSPDTHRVLAPSFALHNLGNGSTRITLAVFLTDVSISVLGSLPQAHRFDPEQQLTWKPVDSTWSLSFIDTLAPPMDKGASGCGLARRWSSSHPAKGVYDFQVTPKFTKTFASEWQAGLTAELVRPNDHKWLPDEEGGFHKTIHAGVKTGHAIENCVVKALEDEPHVLEFVNLSRVQNMAGKKSVKSRKGGRGKGFGE